MLDSFVNDCVSYFAIGYLNFVYLKKFLEIENYVVLKKLPEF